MEYVKYMCHIPDTGEYYTLRYCYTSGLLLGGQQTAGSPSWNIPAVCSIPIFSYINYWYLFEIIYQVFFSDLLIYRGYDVYTKWSNLNPKKFLEMLEDYGYRIQAESLKEIMEKVRPCMVSCNMLSPCITG